MFNIVQMIDSTADRLSNRLMSPCQYAKTLQFKWGDGGVGGDEKSSTASYLSTTLLGGVFDKPRPVLSVPTELEGLIKSLRKYIRPHTLFYSDKHYVTQDKAALTAVSLWLQFIYTIQMTVCFHLCVNSLCLTLFQHDVKFGVEELDWPAQSPVLSPIRHL